MKLGIGFREIYRTTLFWHGSNWMNHRKSSPGAGKAKPKLGVKLPWGLKKNSILVLLPVYNFHPDFSFRPQLQPKLRAQFWGTPGITLMYKWRYQIGMAREHVCQRINWFLKWKKKEKKERYILKEERYILRIFLKVFFKKRGNFWEKNKKIANFSISKNLIGAEAANVGYYGC
jgi:hypothetical protein